MPIKPIFYAMLVTGERGTASCTTRFFTGYSRKVIHNVLTRLAAPTSTLDTGIWSLHTKTGVAIEAHTFLAASSPKWRSVPKGALRYYDLNVGGLVLAKTRCNTIGDDGTITHVEM